jgi:hypothetical protein
MVDGGDDGRIGQKGENLHLSDEALLRGGGVRAYGHGRRSRFLLVWIGSA